MFLDAHFFDFIFTLHGWDFGQGQRDLWNNGLIIEVLKDLLLSHLIVLDFLGSDHVA